MKYPLSLGKLFKQFFSLGRSPCHCCRSFCFYLIAYALSARPSCKAVCTVIGVLLALLVGLWLSLGWLFRPLGGLGMSLGGLLGSLWGPLGAQRGQRRPKAIGVVVFRQPEGPQCFPKGSWGALWGARWFPPLERHVGAHTTHGPAARSPRHRFSLFLQHEMANWLCSPRFVFR